jgi:hypothetical protein
MPIWSKHAPRRRFTANEDQTLRGLVCVYGLNQWDAIARFLPERTPRQCRDRYEYYLAPNVYNPPWTDTEDALLKEKFAEWGAKWVFLSRFFPGRTGNHLKNRWYKVLVKRTPAECATTSAVGVTASTDSWNASDYDQIWFWDEFAIE